MIQTIFTAMFPQERFHYQAYREQLAAKLPERGDVLDLGCGRNLDLREYRTPQRRIWGADFEEHPELVDPDWFRRLEPTGEIPFESNRFDVVASCWVLEHIAEPERFLAEIDRVLKPGGVFIAHSISSLHYVTWLSRALKAMPHRVTQYLVQKLYGRASRDTFPTHYRLNSEASLDRVSRQTRLQRLDLQRYADPGYFTPFGLLSPFAIVADRILESIRPGMGRIYFTATLRKSIA